MHQLYDLGIDVLGVDVLGVGVLGVCTIRFVQCKYPFSSYEY